MHVCTASCEMFVHLWRGTSHLALELYDVGDHLVQKAAVVRDDESGRFAPLKPFGQPVDCREVEVVGGLVEQPGARRVGGDGYEGGSKRTVGRIGDKRGERGRGGARLLS